jgi:biotin carboxyl carrier protein
MSLWTGGPGGGRFDEIIVSQIAARPYFLLILTPRTLEGCTAPGDWLLREIEHAISMERLIVPVVTPDFDRTEISQHLSGRTAEDLSRLNTVSLVHEYWEASMDKLRTRFLKPINLPTVATPREAQAAVRRKLQQASAAPPVTNEQMLEQRSLEQNEAESYAAAMPTVDVIPQWERTSRMPLSRGAKREGEQVQRDELLFEISTDKVDAEIPSSDTGILRSILVPEGGTVPVNTVVGVIEIVRSPLDLIKP